MKKTIITSAYLKRIVIALVAVTIIFLNHGCKKDQSAKTVLNTVATKADVNDLKLSYSQDTIPSSLSLASIGTKTSAMLKNRNVLWQNMYTRQRDSSQIIEFELEQANDRWVVDAGVSNTRNKNSVVFIKYRNGKKLSFFMKVSESLKAIGDSSVIKHVHYNSVPKGFTGQILYYSLNKTFLNGWIYKNGQVTASIAAHTSGSKPALSSTTNLKTNMVAVQADTYCYEAYNYNYMAGDPDNGWWVDSGYMECYTVYSIYDDGSGGGGGTGGDGTGTIGGGGGASGDTGSTTPDPDDSVPDVDPSYSDYLYTCPDNFTFASMTSSNLWQEAELTNIYCNLGVYDPYTGEITNYKTVQIPQVFFGIAYYNVEGNLIFTKMQAQQIAADALNLGEEDMRKKYKANPSLSATQLANYWISRMNYYMGNISNNRGTAARTGSINTANPTPSRPYSPCN